MAFIKHKSNNHWRIKFLIAEFSWILHEIWNYSKVQKISDTCTQNLGVTILRWNLSQIKFWEIWANQFSILGHAKKQTRRERVAGQLANFFDIFSRLKFCSIERLFVELFDRSRFNQIIFMIRFCSKFERF